MPVSILVTNRLVFSSYISLLLLVAKDRARVLETEGNYKRDSMALRSSVLTLRIIPVPPNILMWHP